MRTISLHQLLLLLAACVRLALNLDRTGLASCNINEPNCTWFCDRNVPEVNRSASGSFQTEFLTAVRYQPLAKKFNRPHSIFAIPGIRYQCLELSLRCGSSRHVPSASTLLGELAGRGPYRMLQLHFRCDWFVATYLAYYERLDECYELNLDKMAHLLRGRSSGCTMPFSRSYRLEGDGHRYLLVVLCHAIVHERELGGNAYWLFVNKRNTPQENWDIMRQLQLPDTEDRPLQSMQGIGPSERRTCRCDIFERYMHQVKRCKKPFQVDKHHARRNSTIASTDGGTGALLAEDQEAKERLRWYVVKCLTISASLGIVFYALYMQLERHTEEILGQGDFIQEFE